MGQVSTMRMVGVQICLLVLLAFRYSPVLAFVCPVPPQAIVTVAGIDFYIDDKHSVIDSRLEQQSLEQSKPLRDSLYELGQLADGTGRARDPMSADCALEWLRQWARGRAFTKLARGGTVQRVMAVVSVSNVFRVVLGRIEVSPEDKALIGSWLAGLAQSISELEDQGRPGDLQNNVTFWSALAVYNIGALQHDNHMKQWAADVYHRALGSLNKNGYFPREIQRGKQALRYQWFALAPLVVMYVISDERDGLRRDDYTVQLGKALAAAQAALLDVGRISRDAGTDVDAGGIRDYALTRAIMRLSRCVAPSSATVNIGVPSDNELARDWRLGSAFMFPACGDISRLMAGHQLGAKGYGAP